MFSYLSRFMYKFQSKPIQILLLAALAILVSSIVLASLVRWLRRRRQDNPESWWALATGSIGNVLKTLVGLAILAGLCAHLKFQSEEFIRLRGGVSQTNYSAVQAIWGGPLLQRELGIRLATYTKKYFDKDGLEFDADKLKAATQPIAFRAQEIEEAIPGNPVTKADHAITVAMNYRKKGGASYPTFETDCRFTYEVVNVADKDVKAIFRFPMPASQGLIDKIAVAIDGKQVREGLVVDSSAASWNMPLVKGAKIQLAVSYQSRGMDYVRLDPGEGRQLENYRVQMRFRNMTEADYNPPIGCMTPTEKKQEGKDLVLAWNLDRAVTRLGMGMILPKETQEGYYVGRILSGAPWGLILMLAMVLTTYIVTGRGVQWSLLLILTVAFDLYYLLMAWIADYAPGLAGGMVISGVALTAMIALLYLCLADRPVAWAVIRFFVLFCAVYPLVRISDHEGLLTTILYVALLAYIVVVLIIQKRRAAA